MKEIIKIESIYSPGRPREHMEDGHFIKPPFFGVVDGYSAPYNPADEENTLILFDRSSGGEMVRDIILTTFFSACPDLSLEYVATDANRQIARIQAFRDVSLSDAGCLAGASAVLGKICEGRIEIIQAGDCYAVWSFIDGQIGFTENKIYETDLQARENFAYLMKKHQGDRSKAWIEHCPFLADLKRKTVNKEQKAILNGQLEAVSCWQELKIPIQGLHLLIAFTDGFIAAEQMADEKEMTKDIIGLYKARGGAGAEIGLKRILKTTRAIQEMNIHTSHEPYPEATAIAISFE